VSDVIPATWRMLRATVFRSFPVFALVSMVVAPSVGCALVLDAMCRSSGG
jgi:hypothetical protein